MTIYRVASDPAELEDDGDYAEIEASDCELAAIVEIEEAGVVSDRATSHVRCPDGRIEKIELEYVPAHWIAK